ncbi:MAG: modA [Solimicrobium sp.]|jgi:molybdate transport system substrate-binding protein|nr:modA [Solimicrobium sp.]
MVNFCNCTDLSNPIRRKKARSKGACRDYFIHIFFSFFLINFSWANEVQVAVAANFAAPMKQISAAFFHATGHTAALSFGATGKFFTQIKNGAPFDILLAADQITPNQLAQKGYALPETQFTYALGRLVLWSAASGVIDVEGTVLKEGRFVRLAMASSQAPYGIAAKQTLKSLDLLERFQPRIVVGESIGQAYTFIASGNATLGFVALSQVCENHQIKSGSAWIVPENLYSPLWQDAILLKHGKNNPAALALLAYLRSDTAKKIIHSYGYR